MRAVSGEGVNAEGFVSCALVVLGTLSADRLPEGLALDAAAALVPATEGFVAGAVSAAAPDRWAAASLGAAGTEACSRKAATRTLDIVTAARPKARRGNSTSCFERRNGSST